MAPTFSEVGASENLGAVQNVPVVPTMRQTAQSLKLELHQFGVRGPAEFAGAFEAMAEKRVGVLVVIDDATLTIADVGADTLVTIDGDAAQTIRLVGIGDATAVTQTDFLLA